MSFNNNGAIFYNIGLKRSRKKIEDAEDEYHNIGAYSPTKKINISSETIEIAQIHHTIYSLEQRLVKCETIMQEQTKQIMSLKAENEQQENIINNIKSLSQLNKRRQDNSDAQISSIVRYVDQKKNTNCPDFGGMYTSIQSKDTNINDFSDNRLLYIN